MLGDFLECWGVSEVFSEGVSSFLGLLRLDERYVEDSLDLIDEVSFFLGQVSQLGLYLEGGSFCRVPGLFVALVEVITCLVE